jgi:heptosyltransferase III
LEGLSSDFPAALAGEIPIVADSKFGRDMAGVERGRDGLRWLDRTIGIPAVAVLSALKRRKPFPAEVSTIGLIALGAIGDTIISVGSAIPVLRQAFPNAKLYLFTSKANSGIAPLLPPVDQVHVIAVTDPMRAVSLLRNTKLDVLIDFGPWPRISAMLAALSHAGFTVGFKTDGQYRHYAFDLAVEHSAKIHEFDNHAGLLTSIGVPRPVWPKITPSAAARRKIRDERSKPYIVCHPWASGFKSEMREWPDQYWRELATIVSQQGWEVVFTGGPSDVAKSNALFGGIAANDGSIQNVAGRYSLDETAALLERCGSVVTVNTGVLHLAAAVNAPIVALHGPTDPARWGPLSDNAEVLLPDSPDVAYLNLGFEYPEDAKPCMHLLGIDRVVASLLSQLKDPQGGGVGGLSSLPT